jgi:hypothetical protein
MEFERAAALRDRIEQMRTSVGKKLSEVSVRSATKAERGRRGKSGARIPRPKRTS